MSVLPGKGGNVSPYPHPRKPRCPLVFCRRFRTMTGTLIEDLIALVEKAEKRDAESNPVPPSNDPDTTGQVSVLALTQP